MGKDSIDCQREDSRSERNPSRSDENSLNLKSSWRKQKPEEKRNSIGYHLKHFQSSSGSNQSHSSGLIRNLPSGNKKNGSSKDLTNAAHIEMKATSTDETVEKTASANCHEEGDGDHSQPVVLSCCHIEVEEQEDMPVGKETGPTEFTASVSTAAKMREAECPPRKSVGVKEPMMTSCISMPELSVKVMTAATSQEEQLHECPCCIASFVDANNLKRHLAYIHGDRPTETKSHKGGVKCEECGKTFSRPSRLIRHQLTHTGQKPFVCDVCNKAFSQAGNLKNHQILHTGRKPYVCDVCQKAFSDSGNLKKHQVIHTGDKPFVCDICDKAFVETGHLKRHKKIHIGHKPFVCDVCGKAFMEAGTLRRHKVQTNHNPIICFVCNRSFLLLEHLEEHRKVHAPSEVPTSKQKPA